jgi:hypothetical protein
VLTPARFGIGNGMAEEMRIWFVFESELPRMAFYSCGGDPRDVGCAPSDGAEVDGGCWLEGVDPWEGDAGQSGRRDWTRVGEREQGATREAGVTQVIA